MKQVKFIHGADLHLDSPMIGLGHLPKNVFKRLQESTFIALKNLIDAAIKHQVDFVILAGDLFDNENRSIRAQIRLRKEMERLGEENISVYLIYGNHDNMSGNWTSVEMPKKVHIFDGNVEVKQFVTQEGTTVHLYGFSYPERHVFDRKIDEYVKKSGADFHIGILHGNLEGNTDHGNYAPFQLRDLIEKDFDYWALGHIHKRAIISEAPPIVYPGNLQGRNKKEKGLKGCYLVDLNELGANLQFMETNDIIWNELTIDGSNVHSFDDFYNVCKESLIGQRQRGRGILALITISNPSSEVQQFDSSVITELTDVLQEEETDEDSFVWPVSIKVQESVRWKREDLVEESDFYSELFRMIDSYENIEESLAPLYKQHPSGRKFLKTLTDKETKELKREVENLLIQQLLTNQREK